MRTTILNSMEPTQQKILQVRFMKQIIIDGEVLKQEPHRTIFMPHCDIDAQMDAVNSHLNQIGYASVSDADIDVIKATTTQLWQGVDPWQEPESPI
jgi:hypothetical protein